MRFCEPMENADIPHIIQSIVLPGSNPEYMEGRQEIMRLAKLRSSYNVDDEIAVKLLPLSTRNCRIDGKSFELALPSYDLFVETTSASGPNGYLFTINNSNEKQPAYFSFQLPASASKSSFYVFDPANAELYVKPKNGGKGGDRWSFDELKNFIGVCQPGNTLMLQLTRSKPSEFTRRTTLQELPSLDDTTILEAKVVDEVPKIDGNLSDTAWYETPAYPFLSTSGERLDKPTILRMVADRKRSTLYLGFVIPDSKLVSKAKERDSQVWEDDSIEIFLASIDQQNYFQICINPDGVVFDQSSLNGTSWIADMQYAWQYDDAAQLWFLEIALPLGQFGLSGALEGNVGRTDLPSKERSNLSPTSGDFHRRSSFLPIDLVE